MNIAIGDEVSYNGHSFVYVGYNPSKEEIAICIPKEKMWKTSYKTSPDKQYIEKSQLEYVKKYDYEEAIDEPQFSSNKSIVSNIRIVNGSQSYEERLENKINNGTINDVELHEVLDSGDRRLKNVLNKKSEEKLREKKDLERSYGKGVWDGTDSKGNLYKSIPLENLI